MKNQIRMSKYLIAQLTLCVLFVCVAQAAMAQDAVRYKVGSWNEQTRSVEYTEETTTKYTVLPGSYEYTELTTGDYVVTGSVVYETILEVLEGATVNLILEDDASLEVKWGFYVPDGATLNIYGQEAGTGSLTATGDIDNAGIGGWNSRYTVADCGTITIHGGTVTATGASSIKNTGAGIGGGIGGAGGKITIYGGTVMATGGKPVGDRGAGGAGIGGGGNGGDG